MTLSPKHPKPTLLLRHVSVYTNHDHVACYLDFFGPMMTESSPSPEIDFNFKIQTLDLSYTPTDSENSAIDIICTQFPGWKRDRDNKHIKLVRFTDGITNTLLKAERRIPERKQHEIDEDAVLLRAYGTGTDVLIDRERELRAHTLLASHALAPPLFARFNNGLLYKFISGRVCTAADIRKPEIYKKVARKLGEWHGRLSIITLRDDHSKTQGIETGMALVDDGKLSETPFPNLWTITRGWIDALPDHEDVDGEQKEKTVRKEELRKEYDFLKQKLDTIKGINGRDYVFGHCDLLSGNIILSSSSSTSSIDVRTERKDDGEHDDQEISFIDYEYACPAPAAFDIANHFSEWGGFECDYQHLPNRSQRREFLTCYLSSLLNHLPVDSMIDCPVETDRSDESLSHLPKDHDGEHSLSKTHGEMLSQLEEQVDLYRGLPGFYWGVWALIQAKISNINFDYTSYSKIRFGEYYAWKKALMMKDGSVEDEIMAIDRKAEEREKRWMEV